MSLLARKNFLRASLVHSHLTKRYFQLGWKGHDAHYVENDFDKKWRKLKEEERTEVASEYEKLNELDWKTLSPDQKKACKCSG